MQHIQEKVRAVLVLTREIEEWRQEYDPGTDEWLTLCNLADVAESLVLALPAEMLPEEEIRTPGDHEYEVIDELRAQLDGLDEK
jgi:hypothetical protein